MSWPCSLWFKSLGPRLQVERMQLLPRTGFIGAVCRFYAEPTHPYNFTVIPTD